MTYSIARSAALFIAQVEIGLAEQGEWLLLAFILMIKDLRAVIKLTKNFRLAKYLVFYLRFSGG